jgi:uncharacterized protein (DUF2235 family)
MAENSRTEDVPYVGKRLIVLCDGTWKSKDSGYHRPSRTDPNVTLQVPSNVTRISRLFKLQSSDGKDQIISYESGVGTGSNTLDSITGGAFGLGLAEVTALRHTHEQALSIADLPGASASANPTHTSLPTTRMATRSFS